MADAVKENGIVFQTGSQQRSEYGGKFRRTVEMVRSGAIGELQKIRVCVGGPPKPCDPLPTEPTPEGIDWDAWLGPAPMRGFNKILCPDDVHNHFPCMASLPRVLQRRTCRHGCPSFRYRTMGHGCRQHRPRKSDSSQGRRARPQNGLRKWCGGSSWKHTRLAWRHHLLRNGRKHLGGPRTLEIGPRKSYQGLQGNRQPASAQESSR